MLKRIKNGVSMLAHQGCLVHQWQSGPVTWMCRVQTWTQQWTGSYNHGDEIFILSWILLLNSCCPTRIHVQYLSNLLSLYIMGIIFLQPCLCSDAYNRCQSKRVWEVLILLYVGYVGTVWPFKIQRNPVPCSYFPIHSPVGLSPWCILLSIRHRYLSFKNTRFHTHQSLFRHQNKYCSL